MENKPKSGIPNKRANGIFLFDKYAFHESIGKQAKIVGAHRGTNEGTLVKRFFNETVGKATEISDSQQPLDVDCIVVLVNKLIRMELNGPG